MTRTFVGYARALGALFVLLSLVLAACAGSSPPAPTNDSPAAATPVGGWYGGVLESPGAKPAFTLQDTSGAVFNFDRETADEVTLLYYGYTHCTDVCPTHMATIATALRQAGPEIAQHVHVVFVTTDPERDTGAVLRAWLDHFDSGFIGLTGTVPQVHAAEVADGLPPAVKTPLQNGDYAMTHAAWVTVFAQDNRAHLVYPLGLTAAQWAHDLRKLVEEGWRQRG